MNKFVCEYVCLYVSVSVRVCVRVCLGVCVCVCVCVRDRGRYHLYRLLLQIFCQDVVRDDIRVTSFAT
jgi:hypothetical protein